jgi:cysteine synthase A
MPGRWVIEAIETIERDFQRSADTHLLQISVPNLQGVQL